MKKTDFRGWIYKLLTSPRIFINLYAISHLVRFKLKLIGVDPGKKTRFYGFPIIRRAPGSTIQFGNNCLFHSARHSIDTGLFKRCSFVTLNKDARIIIGENTGASGVTIAAADSVIIGNNVLIGAYCTIIDTNFHNTYQRKMVRKDALPKPIVIEDNVFVGFNCCILKGVSIGKNSVIGANSVVLTDIPPNTSAIGNPCKVFFRRMP